MTDDRPIWEHYTDPIPEPLLTALRANSLVAFTGAGLSQRCYSKTRASLPNWSGLLHRLVDWGSQQGVLDFNASEELKVLLARREFALAAQECRERLGDERLGKFIGAVFNPDGVVPARVHELLAAVPFRGYITTNYDNLLERAHSRVWNRHLRVLFPESGREFEALHGTRPLLKLHGDMDNAVSIVLGHRDYLRAIWTQAYAAVIKSILSRFTVLFVGYGLRDLDVLLPLDQLVYEGVDFRHYLLSVRGVLGPIEKRRLLLDRHVEVIEYTDYFEFHNHVDTFLEGVLTVNGNAELLTRVRRPVRARMRVHYRDEDARDGLFVWHFLFREGAITLSSDAQEGQWAFLKKAISEGFPASDYLVFVLTRQSLESSEIIEILTAAQIGATGANVLTVFLAVGFDRRPELLAKLAPSSPVFLLPEGFSESDLDAFRSYLAEEVKGGYRQP